MILCVMLLVLASVIDSRSCSPSEKKTQKIRENTIHEKKPQILIQTTNFQVSTSKYYHDSAFFSLFCHAFSKKWNL